MLFAHSASWNWCEVQEDKGYETPLEEESPKSRNLFWLIFSEFLVQENS